MSRHIFSIAGLGLLLLLAIGSESDSPGQVVEGSPTEAVNAAAEQDPESAGVEIPADLDITVLNVDVIPEVKRSIDVRLSRPVSEAVLRALAFKLRSSDPETYERTFIVYILPGMTPGAGAWATTHFDPDLQVTIYGFTGDEDLASGDDVPGEVVGSWLDQGVLAHKLIIYRKGKKTYTRMVYKDGSFQDKRIREKRTAKGIRFEERGNSFGEYYLLVDDGNLQSWDREGIISTLLPATQ